LLYKHFANNKNQDSVAVRLRRQRFQILLEMVRCTPGPLTILDVGGRPPYWEMMTADLSIPQEISITLLNVEVQSATQPGFTCLVGDGRAMPQFTEKQFDIVFSNSTIEHVSSFTDQQRMASEIRRVGWRYCIQTPNGSFRFTPILCFLFSNSSRLVCAYGFSSILSLVGTDDNPNGRMR
jgi:hypothetical protein